MVHYHYTKAIVGFHSVLCLALQWKSLDQVHIPIPLQLSLFFNNNTAFSCLASQQDVPSTIPDSSESSDQL